MIEAQQRAAAQHSKAVESEAQRMAQHQKLLSYSPGWRLLTKNDSQANIIY